MNNRKIQNILTDIYTNQGALNQEAILSYKANIDKEIESNRTALSTLSTVKDFSENKFYQEKSIAVQNTIAALLAKSQLAEDVSKDDIIKDYLLSKQTQISRLYANAEKRLDSEKNQKISSLNELKSAFPDDEEVANNVDTDIAKITEETINRDSYTSRNISISEINATIAHILEPLLSHKQVVKAADNTTMQPLEQLESVDISPEMKGFFNISAYLSYADELKAVQELFEDCKHIDPKIFSMKDLQTEPTSKKEIQRRARIKKNLQRTKEWTLLFMKNKKSTKEYASDIEAMQEKMKAIDESDISDTDLMAKALEQFSSMYISVERMGDITLTARNIVHAITLFATMIGQANHKKSEKVQTVENDVYALLVPALQNLQNNERTSENIEGLSDQVYEKISTLLPSISGDSIFSKLLLGYCFLELALTNAERSTGISSSNRSALLNTFIEDFISAHQDKLSNAKLEEQWRMMRRFEYVIGGKKETREEIVDKKNKGDNTEDNTMSPEDMVAFMDGCQQGLSELKYITNHMVGSMNLGKKARGFINESKIEENDTEAWKNIADLYFSQIHWDEVPFDSPIVFESDSLVNTKDYSNLIEVNFIDNPKYKGVITIGTLEEFLECEDRTNLLHATMNISHKEAKNILKKGMFLENDAYLQIGEFAKFLKVIIFQDGSLGINGFNEESVVYMIGEKIYEPLRAYIYKYILECTKVIDRREIKAPQELLASYKEQNHKPYYFKDPRLLYNNNDVVISSHTKNVEFRESHRRLLHEKMIPGPKGWKNARHVDEPLYAYVYDRDGDMEIEQPLERIRIDNIAEDYSKFIEYVVALKAKYNTKLTVIRFQTFVQEFSKDSDTEKKLKVLDVPPPQ